MSMLEEHLEEDSVHAFRWRALRRFSMGELHDLLQRVRCHSAEGNDMIWEAIFKKEREETDER